MLGPRGLRLRREIVALADKLLPPTGELDDLVEAFAAHRGRPVELLPFDFASGTVSGLWVSTERADYIVYPRTSSPERVCAIVCHEIGHSILGHDRLDLAGQMLSAGILDALPADLVRSTLAARHGYATVEEQQAELLGTRLAMGLRHRLDRGGDSFTDERWN